MLLLSGKYFAVWCVAMPQSTQQSVRILDHNSQVEVAGNEICNPGFCRIAATLARIKHVVYVPLSRSDLSMSIFEF